MVKIDEKNLSEIVELLKCTVNYLVSSGRNDSGVIVKALETEIIDLNTILEKKAS